MSSPSPAILVNSSSPSLPSPPSPTADRARSLSPSNSPPPLRTPSQSGRPSAPHLTTRPSPVVPPSPSQPASPSFSRPTSPARGLRDDLFGPVHGSGVPNQGLASPARSVHEVPMSHSNSTTDLNHIFERDVEFAASHHISPSEAVDVAIPPVLDEAAVALSTTTSLSHASLAELVSESSDTTSPSSFPHIPIPRSATSRSFSPDSITSAGSAGRGGRAQSPGSGSATSFSVGTPGSSPPNDTNPLTRHLSEALEKEQMQDATLQFQGKSQFGGGGMFGGVPFPSSTTATAGSSLFSPRSGQQSPLYPPASPSLETMPTEGGTGTNQGRRLSFLSYADVINEERLQELTSGNTYERTVSGGSLDLAGVLAALPGREKSDSLEVVQ